MRSIQISSEMTHVYVAARRAQGCCHALDERNVDHLQSDGEQAQKRACSVTDIISMSECLLMPQSAYVVQVTLACDIARLYPFRSAVVTKEQS